MKNLILFCVIFLSTTTHSYAGQWKTSATLVECQALARFINENGAPTRSKEEYLSMIEHLAKQYGDEENPNRAKKLRNQIHVLRGKLFTLTNMQLCHMKYYE